MGRIQQIINPELQVILEHSLEARKEFWHNRFQTCVDHNQPEMMVAKTVRIHNIHDPTSVEAFYENNTTFVDAMFQSIEPYVEGLSTALELCIGPGQFYRKLIEHIPVVYGIDIDPTVVNYVRRKTGGQIPISRVWPAAAHEIRWRPRGNKVATGQIDQTFFEGQLDAILVFRGMLHIPQEEWDIVCEKVQILLKPGGRFIVGELFSDDMFEGRQVNPGTWYRHISQYDHALGDMQRIFTSRVIYNDGDPCRTIVYEKLNHPAV